MKKYDYDAKCKKCGYWGIEDVYKDVFDPDEGTPYANLAKSFGAKYIPEHIARTCRNCGYSWRESPVDGDPGGIKATCEMAKARAPVIEVGDVVKSSSLDKCQEQECKVLHESFGTLTLRTWNGPATRCSCVGDISPALTLISKGPKVHVFQGVTWEKAALKVAPELERSSPFICSENMEHFAKFNNNKRYTLTLTEEAI